MSMDLVAGRRWSRKRELLPKLQLRYPSESESLQLAKLAGVNDPPGFGQHIRQIVLSAHLAYPTYNNLSAKTVKANLTTIANQAHTFRRRLIAADVGGGGSQEEAGFLLEVELAQFRLRGDEILYPDIVAIVEAIGEAAQRAKSLVAKRGRSRSGTNRAFDELIESLFNAAWQRRGDWTVYRTSNRKKEPWTGTMLEALDILKQYLPAGIFPASELGRAAEDARDSLKEHIAKNRN